MRRIRTVLAALITGIWIAAAAGCAGTGSDASQPVLWAAAALQGGSGRASVESPAPVYERAGKRFVRITWSSSHYDYMLVGGEKLLPVNTEGHSQFEIPLASEPQDCVLQVQADTTAMSTPHLIDYALSLRFYKTREEAEAAAGEPAEEDIPEGNEEEEPAGSSAEGTDPSAVPAAGFSGLSYLGRDRNEYAGCFVIDRYEGGYAVLSVDDGRRYLVVPEGREVPGEAAAEGLIVLQQPLDHIYLAASAAMCQLDAIGAVGNVILSGLPQDGWYIEAARKAMEDGTLQYGGRYSAPDYEKILALGTDLAVESTMIFHTPRVKEKLEKLGIPVLIDRSSYESEPLGRAEWVKVYGLLTGRGREAEEAFAGQREYAEAVTSAGGEAVRTVAVFSINSGRQVVTRTPGDYFAKIVEDAGGRFLTPAADSGRATQTVSMEAFYAAAEDADILIYNASIEDAPTSLRQLCGKDSFLTQFRAVSEGNVWCMKSSLYQNASRTGTILRDLAQIVRGEAEDETEFFYKLK